MKKIAALLPAVLLAFGAFATPAAADDGTNPDQPVADPGVSALRGAFAALREARAADAVCRGADAAEQCKNARNEARVTFQTVRADAVVAHQQFTEKLQSWKDAKTPEEEAAILADLKEQVEAVKVVIEAHRDEISAMRGKLEDQLAKLDPNLREQVREDALVIEKAAREKNSAELRARRARGRPEVRAHDRPAPERVPESTPERRDAGQSKHGAEYERDPLATLPLNLVIPSNLPIPFGLLHDLPPPKVTSPTGVHAPTPPSSPAH